MRLNVLQFSYYSIDIFNILYDSFPVEIGIDFDGVIERYIKIKEDERIKKLKLSVDMADIINTVSVHSDDVEGLDDKQINKNKENIKKIQEFETSKREENNKQNKILNGTILFLKEEGFIRCSDEHLYQLTAKGFSHLNKKFHNKAISDSGGTYITSIKSIISTSGSILSGVSVNLITEMLKNS